MQTEPTTSPASAKTANPPAIQASPPADRHVFRAPTLDRVLAALDFTAFTADLSSRHQKGLSAN
jgi:hypothetical protein